PVSREVIEKTGRNVLFEFLLTGNRDGVQNRLLVREKAIEAPDRDAGFGGNAAGGDLVEGDLFKEPGCGVKDPLDGFLTAALKRDPASGRKGSHVTRIDNSISAW